MASKSFINGNVRLGLWIYRFVLLQFLFIVYSLKGLIILGFFPALTATYQIIYRWIVYDEGDIDLRQKFNNFYQANFKRANQLGGLSSLLAVILLLDLYISSRFIQLPILHYILVTLFILFIMVQAYLYPVLVRYNYNSLKDYIKQSFFISVSSLAQTVAIFIVFFLLYQVFHIVPFIALFFGIPITLGANAWFAFQGILKSEVLKEEQMSD